MTALKLILAVKRTKEYYVFQCNTHYNNKTLKVKVYNKENASKKLSIHPDSIACILMFFFTVCTYMPIANAGIDMNLEL